jgi:hypothetical protein
MKKSFNILIYGTNPILLVAVQPHSHFDKFDLMRGGGNFDQLHLMGF